jgi:hypothetical protein
MAKIWDPIIQTTEELQRTASRLIDGGVSLFRSKIGPFTLLSSPKVSQGGDADESHYLLIPNQLAKDGYSLYHHRRLPEGTGPKNRLPKKRFFHLASRDQEEVLTHLLFEALKSDRLETKEISSPTADRLEHLADEIDKQSERVTGGLLLIAGTLALTNPVLALGIGAQSVLPSLTSKLTSEGFKHASDWFRSRQQKSAEDSAEKEAKAIIKKDKPEIIENEVLQILGCSVFRKGNDFDPTLASLQLWDDHENYSNHLIAARAVSDTYQKFEINDTRLSHWIGQLKEISEKLG